MRFAITSKKGKMNEELKKEFDKRIKVLGKIEKEVKEALFEKFVNCYNKEGFRCHYCGIKMQLKWGAEVSFTLDHTIPRKIGGKDIVENIELVCRTCNFLKGDQDAEKYLKNMERLKSRKKKSEYWKAKKSSKKDEGVREAFKDIFQMVNAKKERE